MAACAGPWCLLLQVASPTHEFTGVVVEEVGSSVQNLRKGDHVLVPFNIFCGSCYFCKKELYSNCHNVNPEATAVGGIYGYSHTTPRSSPASYRLFEMLPMMPRFTVEQARRKLDTSFPTASAAVKLLEGLGVVTERTGQKTNRIYSYQRYVTLLAR